MVYACYLSFNWANDRLASIWPESELRLGGLSDVFIICMLGCCTICLTGMQAPAAYDKLHTLQQAGHERTHTSAFHSTLPAQIGVSECCIAGLI